MSEKLSVHVCSLMLLGGKTPFLTFKHHLGHIEVTAIANNWPPGQTVAHS